MRLLRKIPLSITAQRHSAGQRGTFLDRWRGPDHSASHDAQRMRYIVYGAGSIGGVIAARLFEQGSDVVLIARGDHLSAIQHSGLTIESPLGSVTLPVLAVEHPSEIGFQLSADVVLLATKTQDSAQALDDLRRAAGPEIPVLCLQNGVESARIALRLFERVAGAMTILPCSHLQAGVVQSFSAPVPGIIDLGRFPAGEDPFVGRVAVDLRRAGFHSELRPDILRWQYGKLLQNLKNALQALCGPDADYSDLVVELRMEAESCYRAAGIAYASESEIRNRARGVLNPGRINGVGRLGDSSWQSLARATGSIETDFLNGEIALLGRLYGVPTPLNARLQDLANRFALERRPPASLSVDDVYQLLRASRSNSG
jgi:2-dehydropantoate 2-reductase